MGLNNWFTNRSNQSLVSFHDLVCVPLLTLFCLYMILTAPFGSTSIRASILGEDFKVTSESPHTRCNICIRYFRMRIHIDFSILMFNN